MSGIISFINKVIELLKTPEVYAVVIGIPVVFRAIAEFLTLIGKAIPGDDFAETLAGKLKKVIDFIAKVFKWLGIGSTK